MSTSTLQNETENQTTYNLSNYITVTALNCTVEILNYDPNYGPTNATEVVVSSIQPGAISMLFFNTRAPYPLAEQNWFHFRQGNKDVYFDNKVRLNPTGGKELYQSFIQFMEVPNSSNTSIASNAGQISTTFDVVNSNGLLNDPTLTIKW